MPCMHIRILHCFCCIFVADSGFILQDKSHPIQYSIFRSHQQLSCMSSIAYGDIVRYWLPAAVLLL